MYKFIFSEKCVLDGLSGQDSQTRLLIECIGAIQRMKKTELDTTKVSMPRNYAFFVHGAIFWFQYDLQINCNRLDL